MGAGRARQPRIELVEAAARAHGGDRRRQLALGGRGVVHVVGGDALDADAVGDLDERVVAGGVDRVAVVPQLDEHAVAPERADQPLELAAGGGRAVVEQRRRHRPLATPGERPHHAAGGVGDVGQRELGRALLPRQVTEAERPGEAGVAGRPVGEQHEVPAGRIGGSGVGQLAGVDLGRGVALEPGDVLGVGEARGQRQLGAEHGRQAGGAGGLGEAHDAVEAVVIGEGERLEAEPGGFVDELLGVRGAVEERVVGVAVQLGVRDRAGDAGVAGLERLAFAAPGGAVAAGVPRQRTGGAAIAPSAPRERRLQFAPRPRRVVEPHRASIEHMFALRKSQPDTTRTTVGARVSVAPWRALPRSGPRVRSRRCAVCHAPPRG